MQELIDELRQYALMSANEVKRTNPEESVAHVAYARAKTLADAICPVCCAKDGLVIKLKNEGLAIKLEGAIEACTIDAIYYCCKRCGFHGAFPKSDKD